MNKSKIIKFISILPVLAISLIIALQSLTLQAADSSESKTLETKATGIVNMPVEVQTDILSNLFFKIINESKTKKGLFDKVKNYIHKIACVNGQFYHIVNDQKFISFIINFISDKYGMAPIKVAMELDMRQSSNFINKWAENNCPNNTLFSKVTRSNCKKMDVNVRNNFGHTPLIWAALCGDVDAVEILLLFNRKIIDVNARDNYGDTVLGWAVYNSNVEIVELLLLFSENIDVNARDNYGDTALTLAVSNGHNGIVRLLLNCNIGVMSIIHGRNADVNVQNSDGDTALTIAVNDGNIEIVRLLLLKSFYINIYVQNNKGKTALDIAKDKNNQEIIKLIEKHIWSKSDCILS